MTTPTNDRQDFTAGLRRIADLIDEHPDLELPYEGDDVPCLWFVYDAGRFDQLVAMFDKVTKVRDEEFHRMINGQIGGVKIAAAIAHDYRASNQEPNLGVVA